MLNKIYVSTKKYLKENYKILLIDLLIIFFLLCPTKYDVYSPGRLLDLNEKIEVEDSYSFEGKISSTYVTSRNGTLAIYLLSKVFPNWDAALKTDIKMNKEEDYKDALKREKINMELANSLAIYNAFKSSDEKIETKKTDFVVIGKSKDSKTKLKTGDIIKEVDNTKIKDIKDLAKVLEKKNAKDTVDILVIRDDKKVHLKNVLVNDKNKSVIGVYLALVNDYKTSKKVTFNDKKRESGASAGLMSTLLIYNKLTPIDITKGLSIAGTGTIGNDGRVGEIDGVKYKLIGAVKKHADVFLVPEENYKEAMKVKKKNNFTIKIIKVKSFEDALKKLKTI